MSTVEDMADLPFGFSPEDDDPERDKGKKDPDSGSGQDPLGLGGGDFDISQLGQILSASARCSAARAT
jgi:hypothetical protein